MSLRTVPLLILLAACAPASGGAGYPQGWSLDRGPSGRPYVAAAPRETATVTVTATPSTAGETLPTGAPAEFAICLDNAGSPAAQEAGLAAAGVFEAPLINDFRGLGRYVTFVYRADRFRGAFVTSRTGTVDGCAVTDAERRWSLDPSGRITVEGR